MNILGRFLMVCPRGTKFVTNCFFFVLFTSAELLPKGEVYFTLRAEHIVISRCLGSVVADLFVAKHPRTITLLEGTKWLSVLREGVHPSNREPWREIML